MNRLYRIPYCRYLFAQGYPVRGVTRAASKGLFLSGGGPRYGAFDEAVKGLHFNYPMEYWYPSFFRCIRLHSCLIYLKLFYRSKKSSTHVNGTLSILRLAATQPTITRFVLTSSSIATDDTHPNGVYSVGEDSWNEVSVEKCTRNMRVPCRLSTSTAQRLPGNS